VLLLAAEPVQTWRNTPGLLNVQIQPAGSRTYLGWRILAIKRRVLMYLDKLKPHPLYCRHLHGAYY